MTIDEARVVDLYVIEGWTLRQLAKEYETNHHAISRLLARHGVEITRFARRRLPFTDAHRAAISAATKGRVGWTRGRPLPDDMKRRMTATKLGTSRNLSVENFPHFEKLMLLTGITSRHKARLAATDEARFAFIDKFYVDSAFNAIYDAWEASGKNKWWYPSIDHINPRANGGSGVHPAGANVTRGRYDLPRGERRTDEGPGLCDRARERNRGAAGGLGGAGTARQG